MISRFVPALFALALPAVAGAAAPVCDGQIAMMRTSTILPGKMNSFEKAVADQNAWYGAHAPGSSTKLLHVLRYDSKTKRQSAADDEAVTLTSYPAGSAEPKRDAGWTAFVAEYKASSKIKGETRLCWPK